MASHTQTQSLLTEVMMERELGTRPTSMDFVEFIKQCWLGVHGAIPFETHLS